MGWNDGRRPLWLGVLLGFGFGVAGQLVVAALLAELDDGPIVTMLVPAAVGLAAALVTRSGWGVVGLVVGMVVTAQATTVVAIGRSPETTELVLGIVSAMLGYGTGYGVTQQSPLDDLKPPAPADIARLEQEVRVQLRSIDPQAPGSFERATVLLRKVNEQASSYGPWMGPRPAGDVGPPVGLLDLQAELVEVARVAALAAGARRVIITSSGMGGGIDVQAIFGDPISPEEPIPAPAADDI